MSTARSVGSAPSPWRLKQRVTLAVLLAVGIVGIIAGYTGTSGTLRVSRQLVWVNVAGASLLVSSAGVLMFLTVARREIGRRRLSLFGDLGDRSAGEALPVELGSGFAPDGLVSAPTMTKYHRADCSFVAGKPATTVGTAVHHEKVGRRPCGVCLSEGGS